MYTLKYGVENNTKWFGRLINNQWRSSQFILYYRIVTVIFQTSARQMNGFSTSLTMKKNTDPKKLLTQQTTVKCHWSVIDGDFLKKNWKNVVHVVYAWSVSPSSRWGVDFMGRTIGLSAVSRAQAQNINEAHHDLMTLRPWTKSLIIVMNHAADTQITTIVYIHIYFFLTNNDKYLTPKNWEVPLLVSLFYNPVGHSIHHISISTFFCPPLYHINVCGSTQLFNVWPEQSLLKISSIMIHAKGRTLKLYECNFYIWVKCQCARFRKKFLPRVLIWVI